MAQEKEPALVSGKLSLCAVLEVPWGQGQMVQRPQTSVCLWCDDIAQTPGRAIGRKGAFVGTKMVGKSPQDKSSGSYPSPHHWTSSEQPWPFPTCTGPGWGAIFPGPSPWLHPGTSRGSISISVSDVIGLSSMPWSLCPSLHLSVLLPSGSGLPDSACHSLGHCVCALACISM